MVIAKKSLAIMKGWGNNQWRHCQRRTVSNTSKYDKEITITRNCMNSWVTFVCFSWLSPASFRLKHVKIANTCIHTNVTPIEWNEKNVFSTIKALGSMGLKSKRSKLMEISSTKVLYFFLTEYKNILMA